MENDGFPGLDRYNNMKHAAVSARRSKTPKNGIGAANEGSTVGIQEGPRNLPRGLEEQQNTQAGGVPGRQLLPKGTGL